MSKRHKVKRRFRRHFLGRWIKYDDDNPRVPFARFITLRETVASFKRYDRTGRCVAAARLIGSDGKALQVGTRVLNHYIGGHTTFKFL